MDHSTRPEDSGGCRPDLSPASLFLPPSFNKTLIIFPQLCFSLFCFRPPSFPLYFSLALSGERYAVAPKSKGCGSMGIFQHRDNRIAALTGAIELIRRPGSDNVITAVLRPLIPPPQPALYKEQEMGGGGGGRAQSLLSIGGLHTNNASNLLTLQLWFPDIQLIGLAARRKLNFFINFKQRCLFVLMYANAQGGVVGGRGERWLL